MKRKVSGKFIWKLIGAESELFSFSVYLFLFCLRRRSAVAWFLGSRVWIQLRAWVFVSCIYMLCCPVENSSGLVNIKQTRAIKFRQKRELIGAESELFFQCLFLFCLRLRSAVAWFLGSRVWIPLRAWVFVSCIYMLCCPVYVEASATGWSLVQRSPTVCLIVRDQETSVQRGTRLDVGCIAIETNLYWDVNFNRSSLCTYAYPRVLLDSD
jgi:hypothetical protein